jgi:hypothetical protein
MLARNARRASIARVPAAHAPAAQVLAAHALVVLAIGVLPLAGCGRRGPAAGASTSKAGAATAAVHDPARLVALLRRGAQPGELSLPERAEIERLVSGILPRLDGPNAGYQWRIAYDDLPLGDFVSIDLMEGSGERARRALWMHLFWRGPLSPGERAEWPLRVGSLPARGVPGHHLFVRAGAVELRAVADEPAFRDDTRMRGVLERIDLAGLARS